MKDPESPNKNDSLGRIVGEEKICTTVLGDFRGTNLVLTCKPTTAFSLLLSLAASRMKGGLTACIEARALAWPASKEHQEYDPWQLVDLPPTDLLTRDMSDIFAAYMKTYHHRIFRQCDEEGNPVKADVDRCFQFMEQSKAELVVYDHGIYHLGDYDIKVMIPVYKEGIVAMRACTHEVADNDQGRLIYIPTSPGVIFVAARGGKTRLHVSGDGCLVFLCHAFNVVKEDDITDLHGSIDRILMSKSETLFDAFHFLRHVARPK